MEEKLRKMAAELRKMGSRSAADWLIEHYPAGSPDYGEAIRLISHVPWAKDDQRKLAEHYLARLPFASPEPYEVFASIMAIKSLIRIIEPRVPQDAGERDLLFYHLRSVLTRHARSEQDRLIIQQFITQAASPTTQ